ncbi:hypothetical protein KAT73_02320 [candidate division WOR-3 bacterium]|nr:hypothetical protein [candidate division WOR-3 bacterium]
MRSKIVFIVSSLILITFVFYLIAQDEEKVEEEIRGEYKGVIAEKKPQIELDFNPYETVIPYIGEEEYIYDSQLLSNSEIASSPLPVLASDQIIKPWLKTIVRDYVALFNPVYGYDVRIWKMVITDEKGTEFRSYEGEGAPPRTIYWDGRSNEGVMMNPGIVYIYSGEAYDKLGNISRVVGREIVLKGILYKDKGVWIILLNGNMVFRDNSDKITEDGIMLLEETADIIRQNFKTKLAIEVYSKNELLSSKRSRVLGGWFLERLIIPKYAVINAAGYEEVIYKSSYIKIVF